jgi:hypothetical protein
MTLFPIFAFGLVITGIVIKGILNARLMFQAEIHAQTIRQQHQLKWREHSENLALNPVCLEPRRRRHSKAS